MLISRDLLIIHYHFKKGGVTDVITAAIKAFDIHKAVERITLACGNAPEKTDEIMASVGALQNISIKSKHTAALGYCDVKNKPDAHASMNARDYEALRHFFNAYTSEDTLWWVHNHHLGKNPFFTKMLMEHLRVSGQRCILHMHDFPEEARFANLAALKQVMPCAHCYTAMAGTQYAVINSVDARILQTSGLEAHYIPNIVRQNKPAHQPEKLTKKQALSAHAFLYAIAPEAAHKTEDTLLFTYPVRCIRRKNALEGALITKLYQAYAQTSCNYNITLRGESEQEKRYSERVHSLFEEGAVHGFFGLGKDPRNTLSLAEVCGASDVIISSSVQEGFGFSYLGAATWGSPLLARRIAVAEDSAKILTDWDAHWYSELAIPVTLLSAMQLSRLQRAYQEKIQAVRSMGLYTQQLVQALEKELHEMTTATAIDFSFLDLETQVHLIQNFAHHCETLLKANAKLMQATKALVQSKKTINTQKMQRVAAAIETQFGTRAFIQAFTNVAEATKQTEAKHDAHEVANAVLEAHAHMSSLRLLLSPY